MKYKFSVCISIFIALALMACSLVSLIQPNASKQPATAPQSVSFPTETEQPTISPLSTEIPTATSEPTATLEPTPTKDPNRRVSSIDGMTLLFVPEGEFTMGSDDASCEHPARKYWLDAFWIDQTEVTFGMYRQCMAAGNCSRPDILPDLYLKEPTFQQQPITLVTAYQAQDYCKWAGRRLPTSAEWEKAARGTDGRLFPWGTGQIDTSLCNYTGNFNDIGEVKDVGSYPAGASPYGALDMCGNVNELVSDHFGCYSEMNEPYKNPAGQGIASDMRVTRGGSYDYQEIFDYYTWGRDWLADGSISDDTGFRCAVSDVDLNK